MTSIFRAIDAWGTRALARLAFARDALLGRLPIPTPLERTIIMTILERLNALEAGAASVAAIAGAASTAAAAAHAATEDVAALSARVAAVESAIGTDDTLTLADPAPAAPAA